MIPELLAGGSTAFAVYAAYWLWNDALPKWRAPKAKEYTITLDSEHPGLF